MSVKGRIIGLLVGSFFGPLTALFGLLVGLLYDRGFFDEFLTKKSSPHTRQQYHHYYQHSYQSQQQQSSQYRRPPHTPSLLDQAFNILEINTTATKEEAKKAYRRKMSRHHPDKLIAQGASPNAIKAANQKTAQIKKAYDTIKQAKGW